MIWILRIAFLGVLASMLWVTGWASLQQAIWQIPRGVWAHPWFVATLFDTYFAFLTFYLWVAYRERGWVGRVLWLAAILVLGNIAMASYMLLILFRLRADAPVRSILIRD